MWFWKRRRRAPNGLRIDKANRGARVEIRVDGRTVPAFEGEALSAALLAADVFHLRASPRLGGPRGMFCAMGVCQECVVEVEGRTVPACMTPVREAMTIRLRR